MLVFEAVLGFRVVRFPMYPCPLSCSASPITSIAHQNGAFVTADEHMWTYHKSKFIVGKVLSFVLYVLWVWTIT